jgi:predicted acylesterase/phospholipase RssA
VTKLGLALSGGGFRAAFFHVGVLARLAELGVLPKVEVISTVSGGSIVGAAYYIRLKRLLESKPDAKITDRDYRRLVAELETLLITAVRKNIRTRVFLNPAKNVQMASRGYSRSNRIGDLYDRYIYKPAWARARERKAIGIEKQIELRELLIQPYDEQPGFDPGERNARRDAKVPVLLLNATTLNTGHNWRFEAVRMGEPMPTDPRVGKVVREVDKNMRLEQCFFDPERAGDRPVAPESLRGFPLGIAVAASACVPGLFHPLPILNLYPGKQVQLVDGGVHDNQGLQGLLDDGCTHLIVSDASGQLADRDKPASHLVGALLRSMSISGDRIRDEQLVHARERRKPMALMHLRKGLSGTAVPPIDSPTDEKTERRGDIDCREFGVDPRVQDALSRIRTDLDSFGDAEAYSLMLDGYKMSESELSRPGINSFQGAKPVKPSPARWEFGAVDRLIAKPGTRYLDKLRAGGTRFFRAHLLLLHPRLVAIAGWTIMLAVLIAVIASQHGAIGDALGQHWTVLAFAIAVAGLAAFVASYLAPPVDFWPARIVIDLIPEHLVPLIMAPLLWILALIGIAANPRLLRLGRVPGAD